MGTALSQEERAYCPGGDCLTEILQSKVSTLRNFYNTMIMHHFVKDCYIDKATLTHLMPFKSATNSQLCAIFDVEENNRIHWKRVIGGLLLCVDGTLTEKILLMFTVNKLPRKGVSKSELCRVLTEVLQATDRIFLILGKCHDDKYVYQGNMFVNLNSIVKEIIIGLFGEQKLTVAMYDFQAWAEDNARLIESVFNCQEWRRQAELRNMNGISKSLLSASRRMFYSWKQLSDWPDEKFPCSRCKHATCLYDGRIYMYGGRDLTMGLKDLWSYSLASDSWEQIEVIGERPSLLEGHTIVPYKGNLYMFGGEFGFGGKDETPLWIFNVDSNSWRKFSIDSEVQMPAGRRGHTAVISQNAMHIYGGYMDLKGSTSELWTFDFDSESFHLVYSSVLTEDGAGPRHHHSAVVHGSAMWVYGGNIDLQPRNDLWRWSFNLRKWTKIKRFGPPELFGHSAIKVMDAMLIFGGESSGGQSDQIWRFHFASESWQKIEVSGDIMAPRSFHTCVLVTPINMSHPPNNRSRSVPHLKDEEATNSTRAQRPFSSPPKLSPDHCGPPFKNRVSPLPSPCDSNQTFISSPLNSAKETNSIKMTLKDRQSHSVISDSNDHAPLLHVKEAPTCDPFGIDNPVYQKSTESLNHSHFNSQSSISSEHVLEGVNTWKHHEVDRFSEKYQPSQSCAGAGCEQAKAAKSKGETPDIFVTCKESRKNELSQDVVVSLRSNSVSNFVSIIKHSASVGSVYHVNHRSENRQHLVKCASLQSFRLSSNLQLRADILQGLGEVSPDGNDLYLEDVENFDDELCTLDTRTECEGTAGSKGCPRSNCSSSCSWRTVLAGGDDGWSRKSSAKSRHDGLVRSSVDSGYMSHTRDEAATWGADEETNSVPVTPGIRNPSVDEIHSRYASTYELSEEHTSTTNIAVKKTWESAGERPKIHGRSNTAPQSLTITTTNRVRRKPQIILPEGAVCMLMLGGKESQQKQLGLSHLSIWKCDILHGQATPKQVQRLLQESASYYGK